jgi:hypothetical protein
LRAIVGCVYATHHQFEVTCHNWQSVIESGCKLLSRADLRQLKALCNDNYSLCRDEHHFYEEWEEVLKTRPKYISIMSGLITKEEEQEMNNKKNC